MGVLRFHNKYRAAVRLNGESLQVYFKTRKEAEDYCTTIDEINALKRNPWSHRIKKRCTAKDQTLPVGWCDYKEVRHLKGGTICVSQILCCTFILNGKNIAIRCSHGKRYTREEAILLLTKKVLARLKKEAINVS